MSRRFSQLDRPLTPVVPSVCPPAAVGAPNPFARNIYCSPFDLIPQPALILALGRAPQGRQVDLQIVGRKYHDALVLTFSRARKEIPARDGL